MRASAAQSVEDSAAHRSRAGNFRLAPMTVTPVPAAGGALVQRSPHCACGGGCPRCREESPPPVQTKLKVSTPGDPYEQEADRVAEQVMRASAVVSAARAGENLHGVQRQGDHSARAEHSVSE